MNCGEVDILLCDYVDGTLHGAQKSALEAHLAECAACSELARDSAGVVSFIERTAEVEPPAELLTRILHQVPAVARKPWWQRVFGPWFERILQPRYVMGMAMTMVSFSMLAQFAGIRPRQLRPADLDPVKIWAAADDRVQRTWDRAVKYYDNLRWVIELQSRLQDFTEQEQELQKTSNRDQGKKE
jgi:anti-sigma factor RsiW